MIEFEIEATVPVVANANNPNTEDAGSVTFHRGEADRVLIMCGEYSVFVDPRRLRWAVDCVAPKGE